MLTNNDKTPIKAIVSYQNFNYNNLRKIHGGSNTYVLLIITVQFILFFIALTDYSKWKLISFFTITAVLILYSIYTHDTGQIIMCILDMVFIGFYWFYKKRH